MFRRKRALMALAALAGVAVCLFLLRPHRSMPPLEISLWYWDHPFRLPKGEETQLQTLGVRQLFVHAGTFQCGDRGVQLTIPQTWTTPAPSLAVQLVFNFDYSIVRSFGALSNAEIAEAVRRDVTRERERAVQSGIRVTGVQFDFDCATRRLPKYADLLTKLGPLRWNKGDTLSITALPTWYTSRNIVSVLNAVDFAVPQYYEAELPEKLEPFATVSRLQNVAAGLEKAGRLGKPFYVGVPAYGHALMYDERGELVGLYRDMSAEEAMRHPSFKLARMFPADRNGRQASRRSYIGEDLYDFIAVKPARNGKGIGYHIVYDLPTPLLVAQHLALIRAARPANCRGVILFRYPAPQQTMSLPLPSLTAAIHGLPTAPNLKVELKATVSPWELVETGRQAERPPVDLTLTITNIGAGSTVLAPDAVTLTLAFDRPGVEAFETAPFDSAESFFDGSAAPRAEIVSGALRASPGRANVFQFRKAHLAAGERVTLGPIRIPANGATKVWGAWSAIGSGRFDTVRGVIAPTLLHPNWK